MTIDWKNKNLRNGLKVEKNIVEKSMEEKYDILTHSDVYIHAGCKRCLARFVHGASGPNEFWFMHIGYGSSGELIEGREDSETMKVWECHNCNTVLYIEQYDGCSWVSSALYTELS